LAVVLADPPTPIMPSSSDVPDFAKVIITSYLQDVHQNFNILMLAVSLSAMLVPLLFALFALSTPESRRTIMFMKCVIDVVIGLVVGIYSTYVEV
jgi:hypothetical protein